MRQLRIFRKRPGRLGRSQRHRPPRPSLRPPSSCLRSLRVQIQVEAQPQASHRVRPHGDAVRLHGVPLQAGLEKTRVFKKIQPSGFLDFMVFL
jgi:hypothetical protein